MLRLKGVAKPLANFFASGVLALKEKLGPFLWQFPPALAFRPERFDEFFRLLPRTTGEALSLARKRDFRLKGRARLSIDADRKLRHAIEIRHDSFVDERFLELLRRHDIGLVVADTAGKWPRLFETTSDFVYVRLHGDIKIYTSGYTPRALGEWAKRIRAWDRAGLDVYVYFDNDVKVRAPFDALNLMQRLRLAWEPAGEEEFRMHVAGKRLPRLRRAYGPRVTRGNAAWQNLGRR
jgi:uncharacterized protein YecE (DUF72 family)